MAWVDLFGKGVALLETVKCLDITSYLLKRKNMLWKNKSGFTLIEILLVIAVIGILSSVILVGIGGVRKKARTSAALKTAESATAELAYCYLNDKDINQWDNSRSGGRNICEGAGKWPPLIHRCRYDSFNATNHEFLIKCNGDQHTITCNYADGKCTVSYGS